MGGSVGCLTLLHMAHWGHWHSNCVRWPDSTPETSLPYLSFTFPFFIGLSPLILQINLERRGQRLHFFSLTQHSKMRSDCHDIFQIIDKIRVLFTTIIMHSVPSCREEMVMSRIQSKVELSQVERVHISGIIIMQTCI